MKQKIIIVGPAASGKDFLKKKFQDRNFSLDVSYTTRPPREGEKYGVEYNFISEDEFTYRRSSGAFYEHVKHGDYRYGTGQYEWDNCDVFIMETEGIAAIKPEDRGDCFIIYLNPSKIIRQDRMSSLRGWSLEQIVTRIKTDNLKFKNFTDYDLLITNPEF